MDTSVAMIMFHNVSTLITLLKTPPSKPVRTWTQRAREVTATTQSECVTRRNAEAVGLSLPPSVCGTRSKGQGGWDKIFFDLRPELRPQVNWAKIGHENKFIQVLMHRHVCRRSWAKLHIKTVACYAFKQIAGGERKHREDPKVIWLKNAAEHELIQ